jgi:hypothetical protein
MALAAFVKCVEGTAREAWGEALSGLDGARTLRAATIADDWFQGALRTRIEHSVGVPGEEVSS